MGPNGSAETPQSSACKKAHYAADIDFGQLTALTFLSRISVLQGIRRAGSGKAGGKRADQRGLGAGILAGIPLGRWYPRAGTTASWSP